MSASRRDFLKGSVALGIIPALPFSVPNAISDDIGDTVEYRGIKLYWSGWIMNSNNSHLVARWTAYASASGERIYYASYPGTEGIAHMGECIDLTCYAPQKWTSFEAFMKDAELPLHCKQDALTRIKRVIDADLR